MNMIVTYSKYLSWTISRGDKDLSEDDYSTYSSTILAGCFYSKSSSS